MQTGGTVVLEPHNGEMGEAGMKTVTYEGNWIFSKHCPKCNRIVKADREITQKREASSMWTLRYIHSENATCKKCGRVTMNLIEGGEE